MILLQGQLEQFTDTKDTIGEIVRVVYRYQGYYCRDSQSSLQIPRILQQRQLEQFTDTKDTIVEIVRVVYRYQEYITGLFWTLLVFCIPGQYSVSLYFAYLFSVSLYSVSQASILYPCILHPCFLYPCILYPGSVFCDLQYFYTKPQFPIYLTVTVNFPVSQSISLSFTR